MTDDFWRFLGKYLRRNETYDASTGVKYLFSIFRRSFDGAEVKQFRTIACHSLPNMYIGKHLRHMKRFSVGIKVLISCSN